MTLVELLVVIFIVLTVTALAIPVVAPAMRGRQVREASRLVTAYLAGARSEALRTGRATGVIFERFPGVPEMCVNLSRCQVPATYAGDVLGETIGANIDSSATVHVNFLNPPTSWLPPSDPLARVLPGDLIQFNYQGHIYRLEHDGTRWVIGRRNLDLLPYGAPDGTLDSWTMNSDSSTQPYVSTTGVPYQIFRQPKRTSTPPVQLPAGIVIDLAFSGDDLGPFVFRDRSMANFPPAGDYDQDLYAGSIPTTHTTQGVMIVFAPDGSVERLCRPDLTPANLGFQQTIRPTGPIHFLIGQRERVPVTALDSESSITALHNVAETQLETFNFMDLENLWVTINPRSGQVSSTEMSAVPTIVSLGGSTLTPLADHVRQSRQFALEGQAMGGL